MPDPVTFEPLGWPAAIAAQMLHCSRPTVYRMVERGELESYHVGSDLRITAESIKRRTGAKALTPRETEQAA